MADNNSTRYSGSAIPALPDEDTDLVYDIARTLYEHQAKTRGFDPQPEPYCPSWAFDYSRIAIVMVRDFESGAAS